MTTKNKILNVMLYDAFADARPMNTTRDAPYVITYAFAGNSKPSTFPDTQGISLTGWHAFTAAEKAVVEQVLAYLEQFINVDFRSTGSNDPDMDFGLVSAPFGLAGWGGWNISYTTSTVIDDWDGFAVWDKTLNFGTLDRAIIIHEIGHAMGLEHPFKDGNPNRSRFPSDEENTTKYTVMAYNPNPDTGELGDEISIYDVLALQKTWGRADNNTGDTTYTGAERIIWDTGGTDTLDASGQAGNTVLDLRDGKFSTFADTDDVAIAFNAVIENAIGSGQNDRIVGNAGKNVINAGNGRDTVRAQDGNDKVYGEGGIDKLYGEDGRDKLFGGPGNDRIEGGTGNDKLLGEADNDKLVGQGGHDKLDGGPGDDVLKGDAGRDTFIFRDGGDDDLIKDYNRRDDTIKVVGKGDLATVEGAMSQVGSDVVFDFGDGDTLTVLNATLAQVQNDLVVA